MNVRWFALVVILFIPASTFATVVPHLTLHGHTGSVMSVTFSPDGKLLVSGCRDKTIRLWDTTTGELQRTLTGHTADVYSVVFGPDGKTLLSGSGDNTIRVWNPDTGKLTRTVEGHTDVVRCIAFAPDGKVMASTGGDLTVRLWETKNWTLQHTLTGHTKRIKSVAFSPDGKIFASAGDDQTVHIWDIESGKTVRLQRSPEIGQMVGRVFALAIRRVSKPYRRSIAAAGRNREVRADRSGFACPASPSPAPAMPLELTSPAARC